jgi:hypothetical protein
MLSSSCSRVSIPKRERSLIAAFPASFKWRHPGLWQTRRVQLDVWMAGWQMECCGTPFQTGSEVSWRLRPATDVGWLDTVLHAGVAATIDATEDHHGDSSTPPTVATVVSVATVHCRFAPQPVSASGVVTPVAEAKKWNGNIGDRRFAGFLVRVLASGWNGG